MKFCVNCNNMYYMKINQDNEDKLINYCRNCGYEETNISNINLCVSKTTFKDVANTKFNVNPYIKLDPTLPRIKNIVCPNAECDTKKSDDNKEHEIIYIRVDDINMKYTYMCPVCDYLWNNE